MNHRYRVIDLHQRNVTHRQLHSVKVLLEFVAISSLARVGGNYEHVSHHYQHKQQGDGDPSQGDSSHVLHWLILVV